MNFFKKYLKQLFCLLALIVLSAPIWINALFNREAPFSFLRVEWCVTDALTYFGSVIMGLGTIFLGIITLDQAEKIDKLTTEKENANTKRPFFIIEGVFSSENEKIPWEHGDNGFTYSSSKRITPYVKITNVGDGVANNLTFPNHGFGKMRDPKINLPAHCIPPGSSCFVRLFWSSDTRVHSVTLKYQNLIGYTYSQEIEYRFDRDFIGGERVEIAPNEFEAELIEQYKANVFNIYPQVCVGMDMYDHKTGQYK